MGSICVIRLTLMQWKSWSSVIVDEYLNCAVSFWFVCLLVLSIILHVNVIILILVLKIDFCTLLVADMKLVNSMAPSFKWRGKRDKELQQVPKSLWSRLFKENKIQIVKILHGINKESNYDHKMDVVNESVNKYSNIYILYIK